MLSLRLGELDTARFRAAAVALRGDFEAARLALSARGTVALSGVCPEEERDAGCTPEGERFGVPGLYIADGSLFPTAPGVNPQLAIMALSSLISDRIIERRN